MSFKGGAADRFHPGTFARPVNNCQPEPVRRSEPVQRQRNAVQAFAVNGDDRAALGLHLRADNGPGVQRDTVRP